MEKTVSALKVMQRMERLATNVYRQQIRGFKGEMADTLQKACDNEREHAGTLAGEIRKKGSQPQPIGFLFGMAGGNSGAVHPDHREESPVQRRYLYREKGGRRLQ